MVSSKLVSIQKWHLLAQGRVSRFFVSLDVQPVRLGLQKRSSLALSQKLPFLDGHELISFRQVSSMQKMLKQMKLTRDTKKSNAKTT